MIEDHQLALFANLMGTTVFVLIVAYHYIVAYRSDKAY
jgi:hypothetical protein